MSMAIAHAPGWATESEEDWAEAWDEVLHDEGSGEEEQELYPDTYVCLEGLHERDLTEEEKQILEHKISVFVVKEMGHVMDKARVIRQLENNGR